MDIFIVGGGASGMCAAACLGAHFVGQPNVHITVLEGSDRVGRKILVTGNGRCNYTNALISKDQYESDSDPDGKIRAGIFDELNKQFDVIEWFSRIGIIPMCKNGYYYPNSNQAQSICDALRFELDRLANVTVVTGEKVCEIQKDKKGYMLKATSGHKYQGEVVLLACGSKAAPATGSDGSGYELVKKLGLKMISPVPALGALYCEKQHFFKVWNGIRVQGRITVLDENKAALATDLGELQLTEYGISGIPAFIVSRHVARCLPRKTIALLDFLPNQSEQDTRKMLLNRIFYASKQYSIYQGDMDQQVRESFLVKSVLCGIMNQKLLLVLLKEAKIDPNSVVDQIDKEQMYRLAKLMHHFTVPIDKTADFVKAQVCAGGVSLQEINPDSMECRSMRDLYILGELLDIDGICGGYNLHFAWLSAMLAAKDIYSRYKM